MDTPVYTYDEVYNATLKYFNGDDLATNVFFKYCLQDKEGNYLEKTPDDMHRRLAREFARIEAKYPNPLSEDEIYEYFKGFRQIVPQGSPMSGIGNDYQNVSLSNCFVIDSPEDNMSQIFDTARDLANLSKRRGGVGLDLSKLRPDGAPVSNSAKSSSGAWSFADFYSNVGRMVGQNGRRSAIMLTMDIKHPDIEKFITVKQDLTKVTGANVSVRMRDDFMCAVKDDLEYKLQWPVEGKAKISKKIKAKDLWGVLVKSATKTGEPGIIFWDTALKNLPAECYADVGYKHISTNPCSELFLSSSDSCRLISLNLKHFSENQFTEKAAFNFNEWEKTVRVATRLSDDLVDMELEKLDSLIKIADTKDEKRLFEKIKKSCENGRRTGLGTHGLADALARLNIKYDSDEALEIVEKIYKTLRDETYKSSIELAKERGAFSVFDWEKEKDNAFIKRLPKNIRDEMSVSKRRGISLLTNAPTGSVSLLSQTSSGIEPVFKNVHIRRKKRNHDEKVEEGDFIDNVGDRWKEFEVFHYNVKEWYDLNPKKTLPKFFVESENIDWTKRVEIQSVISKYIDHSISSTINLPEGTGPEIVGDLYMKSWELQCKGATVYVSGSRSGVLISKDQKPTLEYKDAAKRPEELICDIHQVNVKGEKWTILVGLMEEKPYEVFAGKSKYVEIPKKYKRGKITKRVRTTMPSKYDLHFGDDGVIKDIGAVFENEDFQTAGRLVSALLRHSVAPNFIMEQLTKDQNESLDGFHKVVSRVLKKYVKDGTKVRSDKVCPECKEESLCYSDGCVICSNCSWSRCG